jgi:hypothetical protein
MAGEVSHMHLVDDCPGSMPVQRSIAFPVVRAGVHHHALRRCRDVVAFPAGGLTTVVSGDDDTAAVWVKENFGRIKPQPVRRIGRPLNSIAVKLPRSQIRYEHVPVMVGNIGLGIDTDDARRPGRHPPGRRAAIRPLKHHANID